MNQQQLKQQLIAWRHYLHAHPESAFEEQNTSRFIAEKLEAMGIEVHRDIGNNRGGGEIEMRRREGRYRYSCRYRCHSIDRTGRRSYRSMTAERMHGCGHDGHTCIALGAAQVAIAAAEFLTARSALFFSLLRNPAMAPER